MQKDLERHIKFCEKAPPPSERPSHRVADEAALGLHKDNANGVSSLPQPTATDGHLVPCSVNHQRCCPPLVHALYGVRI